LTSALSIARKTGFRGPATRAFWPRGARWITTDWTIRPRRKGAKYFNVNYVDSQQGTKNTTLTWSTPDNGVTVNATATTTVPLRIMSLFGRYTYNLTVTCGSTQSIGNVDIMFVLITPGRWPIRPPDSASPRSLP
jgi:hypothetical protein